jgi:predicted nucleotidyltransferase
MNISLSETFLQTLVAEIDSDDVTAIILGGSHARGTATRYSDVDFACLVRTPPQGKSKRYFYREGRLISVVTWTLDFIEESITRPEHAIWRVPALREARILLDKEGVFAAFQQKVRDFRWETVQEQANAWASDTLMLFGEFAHKMLGALMNHDEAAMAYATQDLLWSLPEVVAVQRGILIEGSNRYYAQVQEAAGKDSAWTHYHRLALCLEPFPAHLSPAEARGMAALRLYEETARLLRNVLLPEDREVIEQTLRVIEEAALPGSIL